MDAEECGFAILNKTRPLGDGDLTAMIPLIQQCVDDQTAELQKLADRYCDRVSDLDEQYRGADNKAIDLQAILTKLRERLDFLKKDVEHLPEDVVVGYFEACLDEIDQLVPEKENEDD